MERRKEYLLRTINALLMQRHQVLKKKLICEKRRQRKRLQKLLKLNCIEFYKKQQKLKFNFINILLRENKTRKCWKKERVTDWWDIQVQRRFTEEDWLENFRMKKSTFQYICEKVKIEMSPKRKTVRDPIPLEKRVAIAIFKMASVCEYRVVANLFGVHKTTVAKYVKLFCDAVVKVLLPEYVHMPNEDEAKNIAKMFEKISKLPQVIGSIDGTHIPITPPSEGYRDFINRKGWPSLVLQAVVDPNYLYENLVIFNILIN